MRDDVPADAGVQASVVLACRDAEQHLAQQLTALAGQDVPFGWELVLADNGSTDRSLEIAESFRDRLPRLVIVDAAARPGPGAARNDGVRAAGSDKILFCDADDEVAPGWLAAMAGALDDHGFVAAQLDHVSLNEAWSVPARNPQSGLLQTDPPFLEYTFTAALGVRRSVHEQVGGFDESYLGAGEDRDYCYRVQLAGTPLSYVDGAVVRYRHRSSARALYRQARAYGYANVRLYHAYRDFGLGRPPVWQAIVSWLLTPVKLLPALARPRGMTVWMGRLGWRVGRLQASVRYRVWAL